MPRNIPETLNEAARWGLCTSCIRSGSDLICCTPRSSCWTVGAITAMRFVLLVGCLSLCACAVLVTARIRSLNRKLPSFPPIYKITWCNSATNRGGQAQMRQLINNVTVR